MRLIRSPIIGKNSAFEAEQEPQLGVAGERTVSAQSGLNNA